MPQDIFESKDYWCGPLGYRPGKDGQGYKDFGVNEIKAGYISAHNPQGKIIDIGCAFGYIVMKLRAMDFDAWGVDISKYALSQAPPEVKPYLKLASAENLPFADNEFDIAFSSSTFEHLDEAILGRAIKETTRVARRGIISLTPGEDPNFDQDITHKTKRPLSWWKQQFPPEFEVRDDANKNWVRDFFEGIKLNLGSFVDTIGHNWVNIDILPVQKYVKPGHRFLRRDLRYGIPYSDNAVDLIRASHLVEHLELADGHSLLAEIHRVLKPGGLVRIMAPDGQMICRRYLDNELGVFDKIQPEEYVNAKTACEKLSLIIFSEDYQHRALYDFEMLRDFLEQAGFSREKIYLVKPSLSKSDEMKKETADQHVECSFVAEAIK